MNRPARIPGLFEPPKAFALAAGSIDRYPPGTLLVQTPLPLQTRMV